MLHFIPHAKIRQEERQISLQDCLDCIHNGFHHVQPNGRLRYFDAHMVLIAENCVSFLKVITLWKVA